MAIYLAFLVPKITAIVCATPTKARPTPGAWNHKLDRLSDFIPIASLLEWQWRRIVTRNSQFYHPSRNRPTQTTQCREILKLLPEPFGHALTLLMEGPPPPPPSHPLFPPETEPSATILERPSEGGRLHPNIDTKLSC